MKTMTVQEFIKSVRKNSGKAYEKFYKDIEGAGRVWSHTTDKYINEKEFDKLKSLAKFEGYQGIFHYFNKETEPFDMKLKELRTEREKVASNNIYSIMAAPSRTFYEASFKIRLKREIVEVRWEFDENTTLDWREINSFM